MSDATFLLLIACLLLAAKFAGWLCHHIHVPVVLGQLLVGVCVGPSLLGWVHTDPVVNSFATIGVIMLMFIAGLETDMKHMRRGGEGCFISASFGGVLSLLSRRRVSFCLA